MALAYLTNGEGSVIIAVVFSAIAATVVAIRLHLRRRERDGDERSETTILERIEAMTDEEFDAWRAEGQRQHKP